MPKKTASNSIMAKLAAKGAAKAHAAHKDDETKMGRAGSLPPGIENGVARLVDIKIGEYATGDNKGEPYFYARAVVVSPDEFRGAYVKGASTSIGPEPLCDTPNRRGDKARKTFDDHYAWMLNELRKLGVDTSEIDYSDLDGVFASLIEEGPHIRFSTFSGTQPVIQKAGNKFKVVDASRKNRELGVYPTEKAALAAHPYAGQEPMVFEQWSGLIENYIPDDEDGVVEEEEEAEEADGEEVAEAEEEGGDWEEDNLEHLKELIGACEEGDEEAQAEMTVAGEALGLDGDEYETWEGFYDAIVEATQQSGEEEEEEEEVAESADEDEESEEEVVDEEAEEEEGDWEPVTEEVYRFRPTDPKTKKPSRKTVEVEVIAVDTKKQTVDLKNLDDGKTKYLKISWERLESADE